MYADAVEAGALGGKLCGAGGGGFLLLFVPPRKRRLVRRALSNLLYVPMTFESLGSQITYFSEEAPYDQPVMDVTQIDTARTRIKAGELVPL